VPHRHVTRPADAHEHRGPFGPLALFARRRRRRLKGGRRGDRRARIDDGGRARVGRRGRESRGVRGRSCGAPAGRGCAGRRHERCEEGRAEVARGASSVHRRERATTALRRSHDV
jgi:hypothetical protein